MKDQFKIESNSVMFQISPSLMWFHEQINSLVLMVMPRLEKFDSTDNVLHVIVLVAAVMSFLMANGMFRSLLNPFSFAFLWLSYNSLFALGGVFMQFQWDVLLLEAGFLTIFFAPLVPDSKPGQLARVVRELIRWLTFRLMFSSGMTKLLSNCPTWWGLTALNYHFETQPLPNMYSWAFHQFPESLKRFGVIDTYIVEILMSLLFYSPIRSLRIFAGLRVHFFMLLIFLTGNYNFFNFLTMVINMTNFDDQFLNRAVPGFIFKWMRIDVKVEDETVTWKESVIFNILPTIAVVSGTVYLQLYTIPENETLTYLFSFDDLVSFLDKSSIPFCFMAYILLVFILIGAVSSKYPNIKFRH